MPAETDADSLVLSYYAPRRTRPTLTPSLVAALGLLPLMAFVSALYTAAMGVATALVGLGLFGWAMTAWSASATACFLVGFAVLLRRNSRIVVRVVQAQLLALLAMACYILWASARDPYPPPAWLMALTSWSPQHRCG